METGHRGRGDALGRCAGSLTKAALLVIFQSVMKALTGIFLETGLELYERKYKGRVELDTVIIDACAMKLVRHAGYHQPCSATSCPTQASDKAQSLAVR